MRPGLEKSALVSTKSPKYLLSIQDGVNDLKKKEREILKNWPACLFLHRVVVVLIGSTFSGGPK